jgi:hypothetical protein
MSLNGWERFAAFVFGLLMVWVIARLRAMATAADVEDVTRAVESIKADHAQELEAIKTSLAAQLHVSQTRYTRQYDLLVDLAERIADLRILAHQMGENKSMGQDEQYAADREMFKKVAADLSHMLERKRPFLPDEIHEKSTTLRARLVTNSLAISNPSSDSKAVLEYFENIQKIIPVADDLIEAITQRVKSWE